MFILTTNNGTGFTIAYVLSININTASVVIATYYIATTTTATFLQGQELH